jgi:hypothetical protein
VDARVIDRDLWEVAETRVDHWLHGLREHRELHLGGQHDHRGQDVNLKMDDLMKMDDLKKMDVLMKVYLIFLNFYLRSLILHSSVQSRYLYKCDINITV